MCRAAAWCSKTVQSPSERFLPCLIPRTLPAVPAAAWLIAGILTVLLPCAAALPALSALAAGLLLALLTWLTVDTAVRRYAWFFPLGAGLALLHAWMPWQTYLRQLPQPACGAEIEAVITEPVYTGEILSAATPDTGLGAVLRRCRTDPAGPWHAARGRVLLRLPPTMAIHPAYGDAIRVSGAFVLPDAAAFPGDFDYRFYLRTCGIRRTFDAVELEVIATVGGWRRLPACFYGLRDRALDRLAAGFSDPAAAQLLGAIFFNYRLNLDPDLRRRFLYSGTIHILSVSGLHVMILASVVLLLLKSVRVPFRGRHLLLPVLVGAYILMTGSAPAAVRAWLMISIWAVARGLLWPVPPLNSVALAALILLLVNPFSLAQSGFQFSFVLVVFLIAGWDLLSRVQGAARERRLWLPGHRRGAQVLTAAGERLLATAAGGGLAWFASCGLIALVNSRIIPAAFPVNIGVGILSWFTLFLACLKLAVGWAWHGADQVLAYALEGLMRATTWLTEVGSLSPGSLPVPRPPVLLILLFYVLLAVVVSGHWHRRMRVAAGCALLVTVGWIGLQRPPAAAVAMFAGRGAAPPGFVVILPGEAPHVLPAGNASVNRVMARWLTAQGFAEIESLVVWTPAGPHVLQPLVDALPVSSLVLATSPAARAGTGRAAGSVAREPRPIVRTWAGNRLQIESTGGWVRGEVEFAGPSGETRLEVMRRPLAGTLVSWRDDDGRGAALYGRLSSRLSLTLVPL